MQPTLYFRKKPATVIKKSGFFWKCIVGWIYYSVRLIITREIPCIVLYNINDKDTTNIVSLQMNVGFNTYLIVNYMIYMVSTIHLLENLCSKMWRGKWTNYHNTRYWYCYENLCCVQFNIIVKKIKLKHPNLTSQILPECSSKSERICSFYWKK
jgi:hypothetical protein